MLVVLFRSVIAFGIVAFSSLAVADDAKPCSSEAKAAADAGADPALADPREPVAVEHLEAGNRAFRVQQYAKAIDEYTAAGLATSAPLVLYNLGQTLRTDRQYEKAIRQYDLFLSRGNPGPALRALVECHVRTMKAELEAAASTAPPSGPADQTEAADPVVPLAVDSAPARPSRWTGRRKIAVGLAAGALVAAGGGIFFGMRSKGFEDDAADLCPSGNCGSSEQAAEANDLVDKAKSNATYANVAYGIGAAAAVGAVVLWVFGAPQESPDAVSIAPQLTSEAAGVAVRWGF